MISSRNNENFYKKNVNRNEFNENNIINNYNKDISYSPEFKANKSDLKNINLILFIFSIFGYTIYEYFKNSFDFFYTENKIQNITKNEISKKLIKENDFHYDFIHQEKDYIFKNLLYNKNKNLNDKNIYEKNKYFNVDNFFENLKKFKKKKINVDYLDLNFKKFFIFINNRLNYISKKNNNHLSEMEFIETLKNFIPK
jgi:hypothetical protein